MPRVAKTEKQPKPRDRKPRRPAPIAADPELRGKLKLAAEAIGVSVEDLCTMVVDGGLSFPEGKQAPTQHYSLEDLGKRLWSELQIHAKAIRPEWFAKLTPLQQSALIVVLRDRGHSVLAIANEFALTVDFVIANWNKYCDQLGSQVVGMRLETIVGQLTSRSEIAVQMAMQSADHNALWKISNEYVEALQSLGVVDRAIHRVDHHITHSFGEAEQAEIAKLVELERKKEKRLEDVKLADATIVASDRLPQITVDYDEDEEQESL